ncbi:MAG: type IV pilus assembly protein PilM [Phycisphaerales bacterium JB063]
MPRKNEAWGIEVGSQAIKAMKLSRHGSSVHLEDFDVLPFKQILTTPDINAEEAIRVNLDTLIRKHELDKSQVVVSVPGHMAFARFAKLPPVEPSKVQSIVAYEAQQQIPFPIDQVEWDYQVFEQDDAPDVEVGIFAITKERVAQYLSNYRAVDLRVDALTLSPVAVYNAFAFEEAEGGEEGTVYLDIGTVSTDIIIVESGGIWLRTLPLGGNHFTEALMKQFKISFARAEKLKKEASTSKYAKQIFQAMRGVFHDLVQEIQRSLGFYQSMNRDAELDKVVGVGSTWKLPGLRKYLKQHLQMEVSRPDGFKRLEVDGKRESEFSKQAVTMATAYGLALQGLEMESVSANILPQMILRQRMWKAKQPWIGAAAACIAIGAGVAAVTQYVKASSYDSVASAQGPQVQKAINDARMFKGEIATVQSEDPRPEIDNYRRSFDYRDLMPKLTADINLALQAIGTQPELITGTPEEIAAIPRNQRRQIWIDEISTSFQPKPGSAEVPDLAGRVAPGLEFFTPATETTPRVGPTIKVTITGRTPLNQVAAASMIEDQFIQWFRDHAEQADRPYEYVVASGRGFLETITRAPARAPRSGVLLGGSSNSSGSRGGLGGLGGSRGGGSRGGGAFGPGGLTPGGAALPGGSRGGAAPQRPGTPGSPATAPGTRPGAPGAPGTTPGTEQDTTPFYISASGTKYELGSNGWDLAALLPERPESGSASQNDVTFTITFDVVLFEPAEARKTMSPAGRTLEPDATQTPEPSAEAGNTGGAVVPADSQTIAQADPQELSQ